MYYILLWSVSKRTMLTLAHAVDTSRGVAARISSSSLGTKQMSNGVRHGFKDKFRVCFNQTRGEYELAKAVMLSFISFMTRSEVFQWCS